MEMATQSTGEVHTHTLAWAYEMWMRTNQTQNISKEIDSGGTEALEQTVQQHFTHRSNK